MFRKRLFTACFVAVALLSAAPARAALLDRWRADDLVTLNDGDTVGAWNSASNRVAGAVVGLPIFKRNVTPAGTSAVRFNRNRMSIGSSPVSGRSAFSIACVFRADAPGANDAGNNWYGKTGLVDAEQGGVTADWGTVLTETGNVGIGTGNPDISTYSTGASLVDSNYHVAVFAWGGGTQTVYVDDRAAVSTPGVSTGARNASPFSFGGINTDENGAVRRFVGDLVEVRFYDKALTSLEASNVVAELRDAHLFGTLPRIRSFTASANQIFLGASVTLSWNTTNGASIVIDQGIGAVAAIGSIIVSPAVTTTYTLSVTNTDGVRAEMVTVMVDPGIPIANNLVTNTPLNTARALTLTGSDPQGSNLTYALVMPPMHGSLSGAPPDVTYTPMTGFFGDDAFTFQVNDGQFDSAPATVSVRVIPPPVPPSNIVLSTTNIPSTTQAGGSIAALRAVDANLPEGDTHTFSLVQGFGDNAQFFVSGNVLAAGPNFAAAPGATFNVRLRATDSTSLTFDQTFTLGVVTVSLNVVINEINYNGPSNVVPDEFIELYNPTDTTIDLSQWRMRGGIDFFFPANTMLAPRAFLVIAGDPATIANRFGVAALGPWSGGLNNEGEDITLRDALNNLIGRVNFRSEFPWPIAANGNGPSMQLVNPALDTDLGSSWRAGTPTPGMTNSVFASNAPPNIRQVDHTPNSPASTNQVTITCKVTDPEGVASVLLAYQVVAPGNYIPATLPLPGSQLLTTNATFVNSNNPAFEAPANWVSAVMHDDGLNGDAVPGDDIYTVVLPPQANRTLVRYRITVTDALGASRRAPFEDDPSLNFAYFVYNGIPNYLGFSSATLQTLPVYSLITRDVDMNQCAAWFTPFSTATDQLNQYVNGSQRNEGRLHFNWESAVVYDGMVYDHVHYRLRGANGRYQPGKRSFRIRFNEGRLLEAKDQEGNRFPTKWRELTTGKGQSNRGGEQFALNEVVNFFLLNKVGVPSPLTFYFHFRVIRGASEDGANQYSGDFWGLNWAQEKYDGNFLTTHDLPKGNLYKLVDNFVLGVDERRYQGPNAVTQAEDFFNVQNSLNGLQTTDWLLAYANYTNWYRYYTVCEAVRHYDFWPSANKNGAWYFEPAYGASNNFYGRLTQLAYDTTDTWGPTWNTGYDLMFNGIFNVFNPPVPAGGAINTTGGDAGENPALQLEYRNVVRELRALLFQPDQINAIIDAHAGVISPFVPAEAARWSNAPSPSGYRSMFISSSPGVTGGLAAYAQDMKNFMFVGGNYSWWIDRNAIAPGGWITRLDAVAAASGDSTTVPTRPTVTYAGAGDYPVDGLVFQSSAFSDPQGPGTFAAMQWRVAEVLTPGTVVSNPAQLRLEWDAAWTSPEITPFNDFITIPSFAVQPDLLYRVRARHKDNTGRWSQWSLPAEFRPGPRDLFSVLRTNLVFNEIMYNPPSDGAIDGDEFEFIELKNIGPFTLNLSGLFFSQGISFTFTNGTTVAPGATFLLARNPATFATRYPGVLVNGAYSGKLNNDGETIAISHPSGGEIISLTYDDRAPWPVAADGFGFSLMRAPDGSYRASAARLGTPGADGGLSTIGGVVINEALSGSTLPLTDMIELLNAGPAPVDISGWYLTDDPTFPVKFRIPNRPPLAPGALAVFTEADFNPTPGSGTSFSLSSFGDDAYLFSADPAGELTGYSHGFTFGASQDGVSFGRYVNSVGEEQFPLQISRTLEAPNSGPRVGPVVITEIHYHPRNNLDEFLELRDIASTNVPLYDVANSTNTWKLNGVGFAFPTNVTIPVNGRVLLVADDPVAFRARFNVPLDVPVFQYTGNLQDIGERLELQAPDIPATNGVPYYVVDGVRYTDRSPWPLAAAGAGASLQRLNPSAYGDDPINWLAATPTPGGEITGLTPPLISSHPVSRTNVASQTATFSVSASGSAPLFYQWRFNGANLADATNSTLVLADLEIGNSGNYSAVVFNGAGSAQSSNATLLVRAPPAILAQPTNVIVRIQPDPAALARTNATFSVDAQSFNPPRRYQWQFNGTNAPGATNSSLTVTNVQLGDEGSYAVVVSDAVGSVRSTVATLTVYIRPRFTQHPLSQTAVPGETVVLSVEVSGNPLPFSLRWRSNNTTQPNILLSQRTAFLILTNISSSSTGSYAAAITNVAGSALGGPQPGLSSTAVVLLAADTDGDGMSDEWESLYGFDPASADDRNLDFDHDGLSNWQEFVAGTDPTNALSFLRLDLTTAPGQPTLCFGAISNRSYTVQYNDRLDGGQWFRLADVVARATNRVEMIADPSWTSNRYYRVATPRQP